MKNLGKGGRSRGKGLGGKNHCKSRPEGIGGEHRFCRKISRLVKSKGDLTGEVESICGEADG